jgi:hypothetical protein
LGAVPNGELACLPSDPPNFFGGDPKLFGDPADFGAGDPKAPDDPVFGGEVPNGEAGCFPGKPCLGAVSNGELACLPGDPTNLFEKDPKLFGDPADFGAGDPKAPDGPVFDVVVPNGEVFG